VNATFAELFARLADGETVDEGDVRRAFDAILAGAWTPVQVGAFAAGLRLRGETATIIVAAARAMREAMSGVAHGLPAVVDTCGTGGDGAHTLNLSTAAALIVAACGFPVAKHGNRSVSSRCGSADVVEALGVPITVPPARQADILREAGIAFLMAPAHHPALKHAAQARAELGVRTIFNVLGPLANPALATHQIVGVYGDELRPVVARALGDLGVARAWVVRSVDGLDELSPAAPTRVSVLESGTVTERTVAPEDFGVVRAELSTVTGGDARENALAIKRILQGQGHPARAGVILNAAAAIAAASGSSDLRACAARARQAVDRGDALRVLERWRGIAQRWA
jgi:anthranilate phosphoribosyltransferase